MKKILADNVRRICKEQGKQMKDLAADMGIDPASLTRALNGNARLDTVQKIATALSVSIKSLFEPLDDIEGYIRIGEQVHQFNGRKELDKLITKGTPREAKNKATTNVDWFELDGLKYIRTFNIDEFKKEFNVTRIEVKQHSHTGELFFTYGGHCGKVGLKGIPNNPVISIVVNKHGIFFPLLHNLEDIGKISYKPEIIKHNYANHYYNEDYGNDWRDLIDDAFEGDESNYWNIE